VNQSGSHMRRFSVVIGFKDWGLERLALTLSWLVPQSEAAGGEVIVSDYGSQGATRVEQVSRDLGARYVYTQTDGVWSRSRALNAGFSISTGRILIATDADMLFAPGSMDRIAQFLERSTGCFAVLQCRDLPQRLDTAALSQGEVDWEELERVSRFRPRYGMGGMIAFPRDEFLHLRGFDERMEVYGGEDMDFAQRLQRAGLALVWLDDPRIRMYHVWHPSSRQATESNESARASVNANSDIYLHDKSFIRNLSTWTHRPLDAEPVAAVVISTRNRARFLADAVYSALSQTVRDIEVIVVDDGSDDDTALVLGSIDDPRLRVLRQEGMGIAAARNLAASVTTARYTVIFDDDDIMLPDRVERHLRALEGGDDGTYGGWIDFQDGDLSDFVVHPGRPFSHDVPLVLGHVFVHATLMIRTHLLRTVGYDTTFRSGSDFNLVMKLVRTGVRLRHYGGIAILRRLHHKQVTHSDSDFQRSSWATTRGLSLLSVSKPQFDFLVRREDRGFADVDVTAEAAKRLLDAYGPSETSLHRVLEVEDLTQLEDVQEGAILRPNWLVMTPEGRRIVRSGNVEPPTWRNAWLLSRDSQSWRLSPGDSGPRRGQTRLHEALREVAEHARTQGDRAIAVSAVKGGRAGSPLYRIQSEGKDYYAQILTMTNDVSLSELDLGAEATVIVKAVE